MTLIIPQSFVEVDEVQFEHLIGNVDHQRMAYCGGESYEAKGWARWGNRRYADGCVNLESSPRTIAVHTTDNRYYIDPTFFKPVKKAA